MDASVVIEPVNIPVTFDINSQPSPDFNNTKNGDKGFPFDDSDLENRDRGFQSHLDDLARRHPELAEHLNFDNKFKEFPFRTNTWGHNRRGSLFGEENSEPTRAKQSSRFGGPHFSSSFQQESEPVPSEKQEPKQTEKPPQVPTQERSRKPNPNVQQSHTVDLGQKQEPIKDTREQRSMSAPPENRAGQQRFVSSINIPVQSEHEAGTSQPQHQQSSHERVIPIHVEGRDEPVIPKSGNQSFTQPQQQSERPFNHQRPSAFGGAWNRGDGSYYTGEPQFRYEEPHDFYNTHHNETLGNSGPSKQQKPPQEPQHPQNIPRQGQPPPQPQQQPQQQQAPPPPPPPPAVKLGPIEQIQRIQKDVLELMNQVEKFNGKPKDKDYAYLDEMLTRNLLKLDDVETEGKDAIRNARKEAIKCIQKCISILEAKANANELLHKQLLDISNPPLTSLEISGISRSGTESSIKQEESASPEEQETTTETEHKDATPMQTEQIESNNSCNIQNEEPQGPVENENITKDVEMTSEALQPVEPPTEESQQSMEVEETKEKKDKKKVKKKVDKNEKK